MTPSSPKAKYTQKINQQRLSTVLKFSGDNPHNPRLNSKITGTTTGHRISENVTQTIFIPKMPSYLLRFQLFTSLTIITMTLKPQPSG